MLGVTDLKKDTLIDLDGKPYRVVEYAQKQMGRGGSIVNTKLKNLIDGSVLSRTFKGNEKVAPADVANAKVQFLYQEADRYHFMDEQSYEQFETDNSAIGEPAKFLSEGMVVTAQKFDGRVINIELPIKITLKVTESPDVVKGDTQSTVLKTVKLENGTEIQTPIFIKQGDKIVVDTRTGSYVERAK